MSIASNYDAIKDGPCSGELVVVTCSVVGASLRWEVTDTSLSIIGDNKYTLFANEDDVGCMYNIPTTTISLDIYQASTTQNKTHRSRSAIESQLQFHLASGFVVVSCTDSSSETGVKSISILGML